MTESILTEIFLAYVMLMVYDFGAVLQNHISSNFTHMALKNSIVNQFMIL